MSNPATFNHIRFVKVSHIVLRAILAVFGERPDMKDRLGASFSASDDDGIPISTIRVGTVRPEKARKYHDFSEEKGDRLAMLHELCNHLTSRESANEDLERYPGGVRGERTGYQISGFPGDVDELGSIAVSYGMDDQDENTVAKVRTSNPLASYFNELITEVHKGLVQAGLQ